MSNLLSQDQSALKMLFTEDIYLVQEALKEAAAPVAAGEVATIATVQPPITVDPRPDTSPLEKLPSSASFEYVGDNNKYFLVLHDDKIHTRINPVHQDMLLKVMAAKQFDLRDLAILNISRYPGVRFDDLKKFFSCTRILMFGINTSDIGLNVSKLNKAQMIHNVKTLSTYSLEDMRNSADKKREFWNEMKAF